MKIYPINTGSYFASIKSNEALNNKKNYFIVIMMLFMSSLFAQPQVPKITGSLSACKGTGKYLITNYNNAYASAYTVSILPAGIGSVGSISSTGNFNAVFTNSGIDYTITVTVPAGATQFYVHSCCQDIHGTPANLLISDELLSTLIGKITGLTLTGSTYTYTPSVPGNILYINGELTVDGVFQIVNSPDIRMGPGALIRVIENSNGNELILMNSRLRAGCGQMWKGIELDPLTAQGASIKILNNSIIEDAQYAVNAKDKSAVKIEQGALFLNNYVGIYVPPKPDLNNVSFGPFENMTFTHSLPLLPAFLGQTPPPSNSAIGDPFAGIFVNDLIYFETDPTSTGLPINFSGLNNGIVGINSTLIIKDCFFNNILPDNFYTASSSFNGSGIYAKGGTSFTYLDQVGTGYTSGNPDFNNCTFGIHTDEMRSSITQNLMNNVNVGVVEYSTRDPLTSGINNNTINAISFGVLFNQCTNIKNSFINLNTINMNDITTIGKANAAINVNDVNTNLHQLDINMNEITLDYCTYGINLNNCFGTVAAGNIININASQVNNRFANHNDHCDKLNISRNTFTGILPNFSGKVGCFSQTTPNSVFSCNITNNLTHCFRFQGSCGSTDFAGNRMTYNQYGLYLSNSSAVIGNQFHRGNIWTFNTASTLVGPFGAYADVAINQFASEFTTSNGSFYPTFQNMHFFNVVGTEFDCGAIPDLLASTIDIYDIAIANGTGLTTLDNVSKWDAKKYLLKKLITNPALITYNNTIAQFFASNLTSKLGKLVTIETGIANLDLVIVNDIANLKIATNNYQLSLGALIYTDSFLSIANQPQSVMNMLKFSEDSILTVMAVKNVAIKAIKSTIHTKLNIACNALLTANNAITTNFIYQKNEKDFNAIYLNTLGKGNSTNLPGFATALLTIANQCYETGGPAVAKARSLYHYINPFFEFIDICCISNQKAIVMNESLADDLIIAPNPTTGIIRISSANLKNTLCNVYNSMGALIFEFKITDNNSQQLDLSSFKNGLYFIKIVSANGALVSTQKILLAK